MSKQDRQGARTPADLERKYDFDQSFAQLEATTKKQNDQISRQTNDINDLKTATEVKIASFEKDVKNVEKSVSTLKQNVTSLQIRMTNSEIKDKELRQSISGLARSISGLESTLKGLLLKMEKAESTLVELDERVAALESASESGG